MYFIHSVLSPTCFCRHSGHPQTVAVIQEYENTGVVTRVTTSQ